MIIEKSSPDRIRGVQTFPNGSDKHKSTFVELLEDYEPEPLRRGQYVEGEILQIKENVILADVDAKRTAVIPPQDLEKIDDDQLAKLAIGDEVTLYVLRTPEGDEDLIVSLNKGLEHQDWVDAKEYLANGELLELEVIGHNRGGLMVAFRHLRGFVPASHVPQLQNVYDKQKSTNQKAKMVGEELPLTVIEVDTERQRLILSAKKAQKEKRQQRLQELKFNEGETVTGCVSNLVHFGAFVDLGGIEGLIHISEIAWENVDDPAQFLIPGEEIDVRIEAVDIERERVSLSRKALLPSPWELFARTHNSGDLVEGVVTNVTDFGAFVVIDEGIEGLLHISEMNGTQNAAPQDVLFPGEAILVRILNIEPERERLGLSQRRVSEMEEAEWLWKRVPASTVAEDEEE